MNGQYISFFHGRKDPEEHMDDWGIQGPIVGPTQISWTYGSIKLHDAPDWDDIHFLNYNKKWDLIPIDNVYYGDFEVLNENDPLIAEGKKEGRQFLTLIEFLKLNKI